MSESIAAGFPSAGLVNTASNQSHRCSPAQPTGARPGLPVDPPAAPEESTGPNEIAENTSHLPFRIEGASNRCRMTESTSTPAPPQAEAKAYKAGERVCAADFSCARS